MNGIVRGVYEIIWGCRHARKFEENQQKSTKNDEKRQKNWKIVLKTTPFNGCFLLDCFNGFMEIQDVLLAYFCAEQPAKKLLWFHLCTKGAILAEEISGRSE